MRDVLIVGGGASGILVATHLAKLARSPVSVQIAEPRATLGAGLAYSTKDSGHLLNVPAGRMSAFPDEPTHFKDWAGCEEGDFVSRQRFGRYLLECFIGAQRSDSVVSFLHQRLTVQRITRNGPDFLVMSDSGPMGKFDAVVIATGHGSTSAITVTDAVRESPFYVNDPWRDYVPNINGRLVSIGTGLSFIDFALSHLRRDSSNTVIGISRTGLLPEPHLKIRAKPFAVPESAKSSPQSLMDYIEGSHDWRAAQDGVRHELTDIWYRWTEAQKREFWNRHLRWWNVHRHRMSPEIYEELRDYKATGRLTTRSHSTIELKQDGDGLLLDLDNQELIKASLVINTTGYHSFESTELFDAMAKDGLITQGPLGKGIRTSFPSFEAIDSDGSKVHGLYAIGPVLLGERFETTAIPEIRDQARDIAATLS